MRLDRMTKLKVGTAYERYVKEIALIDKNISAAKKAGHAKELEMYEAEKFEIESEFRGFKKLMSILSLKIWTK